MIHLDTSALIDALTGPKRSAPRLRELIAGPEPLGISSIVLFEWLRGPRLKEELEAQEALFPKAAAVPFSSAESERAAEVYKAVKRFRGREADIAIAACALTHEARLWALNKLDFKDIPGLQLVF
jgi:predicted nucleic acid-binding protein